MPARQTCEECGAELPANAPQELCLRCLADVATSGLEPPGAAPGSKAEKAGRFGDYELVEEIARGGMGAVYRARQISLNRVVAVKLLLFGKFASNEFVQRFQTEAQAAASLQHPNIVAIHEIGVCEGQHYFSMDYVAGKNLADLVREHPLPAKRAAGYVRTIAEAVHHAHQRGILHRDLKPSNVLIDGSDQPRITDFGLAKQLTGDSELTTTGQVLGSPNYMSPEQASPERGEVGPASDVYSLGALLYHLLTGRAPFLAETLEDTLLQLLNRDPVAPRLLNPGIPRDLETICLKCLEKNPQRRYESALALADDLRRFLDGQPVVARPASPPEKLWRWSRRKPALAALGVILSVVAIGVTWSAIHLRRMQEEIRKNLYAAEMNLALRDFLEGNTVQALDRLQQQIPAGRQTDLRGFEWRYLARQCRGNYSQSLPVRGQIVGQLQFSPNGKLVATYAWDENQTLRVWNLETQQLQFTNENVTSFGGFSGDGQFVVVSREDESVQLLQAETGATNRTISDAGVVVAASAMSQSAVTVSSDQVLKVWELTNGQSRCSLPNFSRDKLATGWGYPFALSPDGKILAMVERDPSPLNPDVAIRFWDVTTQKELPLLEMKRRVYCLEFSPDGKVLAVGDEDGKVTLCNLASRENSVTFKAHDFPVRCLAFSPDGRTFATGSSDVRSIRLWEVATGLAIQKTFSGQIGDVWSLAFSPDGKQLASGTRDGPVRIWSLAESEVGEIIGAQLHAHDYGNFIFSPDSQWMAAGCADHTVKVWSVATLQLKSVLTNATYVVAFSSDGQRLLVSNEGGIPRWRNVDGPTEQRLPSYTGKVESMIAVDLTPQRDMAALGLTNGWIQLWEIESGRPVGAPWAAHIGSVRSLAFSPRGDLVASGGMDKTVKVWDAKTGRLLGESSEHRGNICAVAISPSGQILASGCGAETIKLWDVNRVSEGSVVSISHHKSVVRTLAFSPNGQTLASGSEDNTVKLWRLDLGRTRLDLREVASFQHKDHVRLVVFSPDGNTLATVTDHGSLRLFRTVPQPEYPQ